MQQEEKEISEIASAAAHEGGRPEWFLTSVAHATELAIAYPVRKEVLRRAVAIEGEYNHIDLCLVKNDVHTASLEIKRSTGPKDRGTLRKDVRKVLAQSIPSLPRSQRYNGWILILEEEGCHDDAKRLVRDTIAGIADLGECVVSAPIPINRTGGAVQIHYGCRYAFIRVVVFNAVKTSAP